MARVSRGRSKRRRAGGGVLIAVALLLAAVIGGPLAAAETGRIEGKVARADGSPVGGVQIYLDGGSSAAATTDSAGRFEIEKVAPGTHGLALQLGSNIATADGVEVEAGATTELEKVVDWVYSYTETLTVVGASRRVERVVDAPAAVSIITPEQIGREAATGQLPKLFESAPGAEITQSGLYDFKFNVRGANTLANRRIAVLVDGRNPAAALQQNQEWAGVTFPLDDLASAELVRGPSSALYGANAFNGVFNLITRSPRDHQGGFVRLSGGELGTAHADFGVYTELGGGWYFKGLGGYHESDDFRRSRTAGVEYSEPCPLGVSVDCLGLEVVSLAGTSVEVPFASVRFDKELDAGRSLILEGGTSKPDGFLFASSSGRFQVVGAERPWARLNFSAPSWNLLAYYTGREAEAVQLATAGSTFSEDNRLGLELQTRWDLADGRGRLVAGAAWINEEVTTANPQGVQTLLDRAIDADYEAAFAQFDYDLDDDLKLVLAARYDDGTLHTGRLSPKAALVWALKPMHTLRVGYNEAFLVPGYPDFFARVEALLLDLSGFEAFCSPFGVSCGFGRPVPVLGLGNPRLEVEEIRSFELGYRAILGGGTFLTVDAYSSDIENFVRSGVPVVGTVLGRVLPEFGPYAAPAGLPPAVAGALVGTLQGALGPFFPFLSNPVADRPELAFATFANIGKIETRGVELAIEHTTGPWNVDFNYSLIDFDFREELPEAPLGFNTPENKFNLGLGYRKGAFAGSLRYRWVDTFRWTEGLINGVVPSYEVVNLVAVYELSDGWEVGLNVSNLLDDEHWEVFSGDLMRRHTLAHVKRTW